MNVKKSILVIMFVVGMLINVDIVFANDDTVMQGMANNSNTIDQCNSGCSRVYGTQGTDTVKKCQNYCTVKFNPPEEESDSNDDNATEDKSDDEIVIDGIVNNSNNHNECTSGCTRVFVGNQQGECLLQCESKYKPETNLNDEVEVSDWDKLFATATNPAECGGIMTSRFLELLVQIYNTIILVAGVGAILLAASEFLKATSSDEKDSVNKAFKRLMTRIVILIILFILPQIIIFILNTFGDEAMKTCLERF